MARKYLFDPDVVHECAMKSLGQTKPKMFEVFGEAMEEKYPQVLDHHQPWILSIAGGSVIQMKLFYASTTEYIMIWGTPIGAGGHSGRHMAGFWDTIIDGEAWYAAEGEFEKRVYKSGDQVYVGPGQARVMDFRDGVWAVEYARGFIPYSMPFGTLSALVDYSDWVTVAQTLSVYADLTVQSMAQKAPVLRTPLNIVSGLARMVTQRLIPPPEVPAIPKENIKFFR